MKNAIAWSLFALVLSVASRAQNIEPEEHSARASREILFVCEHGVALSIVSAAYFNKLAKEQHLDMHAIARGISPQENLAHSVSGGLKADGVPSEVQKPQALSEDDLRHADYVVAFDPLPEKYSTNYRVEYWSDVPTGAGYDKLREAILKHMRPLLEKLEAKAKKP
jgi:hypothetical protein